MACTQVTVGTPGGTGFTITADKTSGMSAYTTNITISKPDDPNGIVRLAVINSLNVTSCLIDNIQLDAQGNATYQLQITENTELMALGGLGCTCLLVSLCAESNHLKFTVGLDWTTIALGVAALGVVYLFTRKQEPRQAPYISVSPKVI